MSVAGRARLLAEGWGYLAVWRLVRLLPERWALSLFERMSARSYRRNHRLRRTVTENLRPVVGDAGAEEAAREAFRWYGRYWAETFRMQDVPQVDLDRRFSVEGLEKVDAAMDAGTGAILALPHVGNWDAAGRWAAKRWGITVVVEVLKPRMVFERFLKHRRALGMEIIPFERGADVFGRCAEVVGRGGLIALLCDRDLSGSGVQVQMFGRTTKMPAGPAALALRTRAPLFAAAVYQRDDGRWVARVEGPLTMPPAGEPEPIRHLTQEIARTFERLILVAPAQWHVFGRYWIDERERVP